MKLRAVAVSLCFALVGCGATQNQNNGYVEKTQKDVSSQFSELNRDVFILMELNEEDEFYLSKVSFKSPSKNSQELWFHLNKGSVVSDIPKGVCVRGLVADTSVGCSDLEKTYKYLETSLVKKEMLFSLIAAPFTAGISLSDPHFEYTVDVSKINDDYSKLSVNLFRESTSLSIEQLNLAFDQESHLIRKAEGISTWGKREGVNMDVVSKLNLRSEFNDVSDMSKYITHLLAKMESYDELLFRVERELDVMIANKRESEEKSLREQAITQNKIDNDNVINELLWANRHSNSYVPGDMVCTPDNKIGYVEETNEKNSKISFTGIVSYKPEFFFFGKNTDWDGKNLKVNGINETEWMENSKFSYCPGLEKV